MQPTRHNRETWKYRAAMDRAGQELLRKKKAELMEGGEKGQHQARDLISLLLKANMAADESQRITDEDILARGWLV
jgi:vacuolar-type H+-ATPase subunit D/Vma8